MKKSQQKNRAPSSILHEAKIAYYARNMSEPARLVFRKVNVTSRHIDRLAATTCFRKVNVTSRHIDRLAAPTCFLGERSDVMDFFLMTVVDMPMIKHNMLKS